jgi:hypothetical protein
LRENSEGLGWRLLGDAYVHSLVDLGGAGLLNALPNLCPSFARLCFPEPIYTF